MFEQSTVGTKLTGFYRGKVLEHGPAGKCKIFWPGVNPSEWSTDAKQLPYAEQAAPLFAAAKDNDGLFFYPEIGSIVWGFFENGDVNYPVYFASFLGTEQNSIENYGFAGIGAEVKKDAELEPNPINKNKSFKTALLRLGSLEVMLNGEQSSIEIRSEIADTSSSIVLSKEGIEINTNKDISINGRTVMIESGESTNVTAAMDVTVTAGGVDETGARIPGDVRIIGNSVVSMSTGGSCMMIGNTDAIEVI